MDDKSPCPKNRPRRLTFTELQTMRDYVESGELRHFSLASLALYAKRLGELCASAATWSRTIRDKGWMRPRLRVHPKSNKLGVRATAVGERLHVDVTVIRLLDGTKVFVKAVVDNFSRKILSWRISLAIETWRTGDLLRDAARLLVEKGLTNVTLLADSGVVNVNDAVDGALAETGIKRLLAQVEITWSKSMIEAIWRELKYDWPKSIGQLGDD
jgi:transposase InsO family protein